MTDYDNRLNDDEAHDLVLIATRTADRCPLLLTDEDWDSLRRTHCLVA